VWDVAQAQRVTFRARFLGSREKRARNENENENDENENDDERKKALARPPGVGLPSRPWAFPKLPWSELSDPTCIETARGVPLLTSGFTGMAWKAHYTADMCMALVWALAAGGSPSRTPAAFLYPAFFLVMIAHRARRDETRCLAKYGEDWRRFRKAVPYVWVPGIA
jgi:delta24(24(1))-sterol reductase